jgi:hypothetical protein
MSIFEQVIAFIHRPDPDSFQQLAFDVFRHQFDSVAAYRHYCAARGVNPSTVGDLDEIPAVSNVAFKYVELAGEHANRSRGAMVFVTSGTTQGRERRGCHVVARPDIYRASALAHLRAMLFADGRKTAMLAMHPTADIMPESSLATMITWCIEEFGEGARLGVASRDGVDIAAAIRFILDAEMRGQPVCILGTTASYAALFAGLGERGAKIRLAPSSRMMDTGGAKGQLVPLKPSEVVALATERLGVAPAMVINEYGMTELCSQLYDATPFNTKGAPLSDERFKLAPIWMRVTARDPVTMKPVREGDPGLLTFFDLANVGSVSAVMTEDIGTVERGRVRVIGRAGVGAARGCALSIGQFAASESWPGIGG